MSKGVWKLTNEEYEFIKGEVANLFVILDIKCVPVSGFEIATKLGATLIPYSSLKRTKRKNAFLVDEDGFVVEKNGKNYIYYNDIDKCYKRQNWTILHEVAHIVLDHVGVSKHEEDEADFFAKYAIAPPVLVHKIGATSPHDIYEKFDVSRPESKYAYEYYLTWERRYKQYKRLELYEKIILSCYRKEQESIK